MRAPLVAVAGLVAALTLAACEDHHRFDGHFGSRVDVRVEVTATSGRVTFTGRVFSLDQDALAFAGTAPFTAEFPDRRLPVEVEVRRATGFGIPLTLCLTELDHGRRRCRTSTAPVVRVEV
jgi:hypothetical protein